MSKKKRKPSLGAIKARRVIRNGRVNFKAFWNAENQDAFGNAISRKFNGYIKAKAAQISVLDLLRDYWEDFFFKDELYKHVTKAAAFAIDDALRDEVLAYPACTSDNARSDEEQDFSEMVICIPFGNSLPEWRFSIRKSVQNELLAHQFHDGSFCPDALAKLNRFKSSLLGIVKLIDDSAPIGDGTDRKAETVRRPK
jgi:hypothetical protein